MHILVLILTLSHNLLAAVEFSKEDVDPKSLINSNETNRDMYVIHAMVYQVGIITNKTNDDSTPGDQEAVTFYHTNGSGIDLANIPAPLVTNVTAQRIIGLAPLPSTTEVSNDKSQMTWNDHLAFLRQPNPEKVRTPRSPCTYVDNNQDDSDDSNSKNIKVKTDTNFKKYKRSLDNKMKPKEKKSNDEILPMTPVKIVQGTSIIPEAASLQSLAMPPLISFSNNFSEIPIPIPNTSVVHYAKINTLVQEP